MSSSAPAGPKSAVAAVRGAPRARTGWPPPLAVAAAAEELDAVGDDLDRLALGAVLGLPLAPVEAAVDPDRAALGEVLRAALGLVAPDGDVEVVRLVGPLAGHCVLAARVHGDAELAHGGPARGVAQLGVARQVADEDDAVDVAGHYSSPSSVDRARATSSPRRPAHAHWLASNQACRDRVRQVAHDAVGDPEDARDLVERLGLGAEREQVVDALALLVDLVREPAAAPRRLAVPRAAALLDELARALTISFCRSSGSVGVEHEQDLVVVHVPGLLPLPSVLGGLAGRRARERRAKTRQEAADSVASPAHGHGSLAGNAAAAPRSWPPPSGGSSRAGAGHRSKTGSIRAEELRVRLEQAREADRRPRRVRRRGGSAGRRGRAAPLDRESAGREDPRQGAAGTRRDGAQAPSTD